MKISVIIPVYNEENYIEKILERINEINLNLQIIVVNDGSHDKTKKLLLNNKSLYSDFVDLVENQGKGFAIYQGLKKVQGDIVLIQDADSAYD